MELEDVQHYLDENENVLARAIAEVQRLVEFFITDWANVWEFSVEQIEKARIKEAARILAKAERKGIADPDDLFRRCEQQDGRDRFPVHDLLGVRVLVRSLSAVTGVKLAVEELQAAGDELYPLGNTEDFDLEDINAEPRASGYRALHINGSVTVRVGEQDFTVPFEVQVKTLAQHVFGQNTHEGTYVPDAANQDSRYELVRGLQRALAEQLNAADLLLAQLEEVADAVRDDIMLREAGAEIDAASVANAVRETTGLRLREPDAARLAELLQRSGCTSTAEFEGLVDPSGDAAALFAGEFSAERRRRPTTRELVEGLVERLAEERAQAAAQETLEERLDEETPADPLDELDPDADVDVPEADL